MTDGTNCCVDTTAGLNRPDGMKAARELEDFFEGRGRFVANCERVGMDASSIPELYVEYFQGLPAAERSEAAGALVAVALGRDDGLRPYIAEAMHLLAGLCMRGASSAFAAHVDALATTFTDPVNVAAWLAAGEPCECDAVDQAGQAGTGSHISGWRYALALWGPLYMLGSAAAEPVYRRLVGEARSARFREALVRTRRVYDELV